MKDPTIVADMVLGNNIFVIITAMVITVFITLFYYGFIMVNAVGAGLFGAFGNRGDDTGGPDETEVSSSSSNVQANDIDRMVVQSVLTGSWNEIDQLGNAKTSTGMDAHRLGMDLESIVENAYAASQEAKHRIEKGMNGSFRMGRCEYQIVDDKTVAVLIGSERMNISISKLSSVNNIIDLRGVADNGFILGRGSIHY